MIDLHVGVDAVLSEVENSDTESSVADESVKSVEFRGQLLGYFIRLLQVFKLDLHRVDFRNVSILLESFLSVFDVLLLLAEKVEGSRVVLEDMGADTETDPSGSTCHDIDLECLVKCQFVRIVVDTLPERSGMSVLGSKVLLLPNMLSVSLDYG
jgi:hypothetical protein